MSKWKEVRLESEVDFIDGDRGKNYPKQDEYLEEGYCIFLNTSNITKQGFNFDNLNYISRDKDMLLKKGKLEYEDIVVTTRGTIGNIGYYRKNMYSNIRINSSMLILRTRNNINPMYLYYLLKTNSLQENMILFSSGSAQPQLPIKDLKNIKIKIPDLETQEKIAQVLSSYDELIENNNRRIELLENMAEEIYKEWFVRMRFPGHEEVRFEKGIPEGWEVKKIGDVINFDIGGGWGKEIYEDNYMEPAHVIRGTDIPDMKYGLFNFENLRYHKENNLEKRKLMDGDIIFEASGGSSNQRLGRTLYITDDILKCYDEEVICASFCKLIRVENYVLRWYIKNYLEYAYKTELLSTFEVQSTGISNFGFSNFKKLYSLLIPDKVLLEKFYLLTYQMYSKQINLGIQNQNLIKQRDMLLPRLMNGTIEVK